MRHPARSPTRARPFGYIEKQYGARFRVYLVVGFDWKGTRLERWSYAWIAVGMWIATLRSRGFEPGPAAVEGRHWALVNLVGKGGRLRTVSVPSWCKELVDAWFRHSGVSGGKVFRRVLKGGILQGTGVTANVVCYAVKRCAGQAGINNLAPHDFRRTCARLCHGCGGELEQIQFLLGPPLCKQRNGISEAN